MAGPTGRGGTGRLGYHLFDPGEALRLKKAAPVPAAFGHGRPQILPHGEPSPVGKGPSIVKEHGSAGRSAPRRSTLPARPGQAATGPSIVRPGRRAFRLPGRGVRLPRRGTRVPGRKLASGGRGLAPGGEPLASRGEPSASRGGRPPPEADSSPPRANRPPPGAGCPPRGARVPPPAGRSRLPGRTAAGNLPSSPRPSSSPANFLLPSKTLAQGCKTGRDPSDLRRNPSRRSASRRRKTVFQGNSVVSRDKTRAKRRKNNNRLRERATECGRHTRKWL